ncbi:hypothetical protein [Ramlibacter sp.]|uniref:hypothetical protein n=1 Tax=Ramlibacter sp. TaxID=1917967 RepID=UPI002626ED46|nr:hypothetical protein [Ramlibacter sp.]
MSKVLWGIWWRDTTYGDTSAYFLDASSWVRSGQVNILWSPLYTAYFGWMESLFQDARAAVLVHRVALVVATTLLAAWAGKRYLGPLLGFLVALWWVALPIHYDTLYEVHLFGAVVAFCAVGICSSESDWRLPLLVALYALATVLLRNENIICFGMLGLYFLFRVYQRVRVGDRAGVRRYAWRGGVVAVFTLLVVAYFYQISTLQGWRQINEASAPKHRLNMCQVYAFGYQQRYSDWTQSPWTECQTLMKRDFGDESPSITEMLLANPGATLEHFAWNLSLLPAGLQVLAFNATSFSGNPDYAPVMKNDVYPTVLAMAVVALAVAAAVFAWRRRRATPTPLSARDVDFLVLLVANIAVALAVVLTQRPRPSYLLGFGFILLVALCRLLRTAWPRATVALDKLFVVAAIAAVLAVPSYASLNLPSMTGRLNELYTLLKDHKYLLCRNGHELAIGEYTSELRNYICGSASVTALPLESIPAMNTMNSGSIVAELQRRHVHAVILDNVFLRGKTRVKDCHELDAAFAADGWFRMAFSGDGKGFCDAAYLNMRPSPY